MTRKQASLVNQQKSEFGVPSLLSSKRIHKSNETVVKSITGRKRRRTRMVETFPDMSIGRLFMFCLSFPERSFRKETRKRMTFLVFNYLQNGTKITERFRTIIMLSYFQFTMAHQRISSWR